VALCRPVIPDPARQSGLVDLAGGEPADHDDSLSLVDQKIDVVQTEEGDERKQRRPLVAVHERVIARDPECVGRGEFREIRVSPAIDRPTERRFERALVADARWAAEQPELAGIKGLDQLRVQPNRFPTLLRYFASSLRALR
jgi:hypothetical protein